VSIEILHERDSDGGCELTVFVDGQRVDNVHTVDIDPGRGYTREDWEESKTYVAGPEVDLTPAFRAAVLSSYDDASETYIDNRGWIQLDLEITNIYEDGEEVVVHETVWVPDPPDTEGDSNSDEFDEWAEEYILPLTGSGRTDGDAGYFAEVKAVRNDSVNFGEHPLVGRTFEFGV